VGTPVAGGLLLPRGPFVIHLVTAGAASAHAAECRPTPPSRRVDQLVPGQRYLQEDLPPHSRR